MKPNTHQLLFRYRLVLGAFIFGLIVSGLTAFILPTELEVLSRFLGISDSASYLDMQGLQRWIAFVDFGLHQTFSQFPYFGYATDWLAFSHIVIAAFFVLPFANPTRYRAILNIGLAACAGVIVIALVCGPIRGIPIFWRLIDCSFGVVGAIPLLYCLHLSKRIR